MRSRAINRLSPTLGSGLIQINAAARLPPKWCMASRRISNIEVAGIATIVLSVAVLAVVLLSAW